MPAEPTRLTARQLAMMRTEDDHAAAFLPSYFQQHGSRAVDWLAIFNTVPASAKFGARALVKYVAAHGAELQPRFLGIYGEASDPNDVLKGEGMNDLITVLRLPSLTMVNFGELTEVPASRRAELLEVLCTSGLTHGFLDSRNGVYNDDDVNRFKAAMRDTRKDTPVELRHWLLENVAASEPQWADALKNAPWSCKFFYGPMRATRNRAHLTRDVEMAPADTVGRFLLAPPFAPIVVFFFKSA